MNCEIAGKSFPVEQPATVGELQQLVRDAAARGHAVYPVGGRTMLDLGMPPARDGVAIDTTRLDRVIDYPSRDMTITVEAGIRIAKLQEILRAEGQRLPIDVPRAPKATLGGAIAANTSGPRRYGFGTFRDYVIGISVVDAAGNETKAGGRVVKNVAGYDLCKLYTGSLGTLGVITQVTLKLKPLPESSALVWMKFDDSTRVAAALERLAVSGTRPTAIELLSAATAKIIVGVAGMSTHRCEAQPSVLSTQYSVPSTQPPPTSAQQSAPSTQYSALGTHFPLPSGGWVLVVGFEESVEGVKWQVAQLARELHELSSGRQIECDGAATGSWHALAEFQSATLGPVTFKANVRSSRIVEFCDAVRSQSIDWLLQAHVANGIVFGHATQPADLPTMERSLADLRSLATTLGGNLVLRRCPTEWKSRLPVWGEPRGDGWLMRAIKRKLDPGNVLNPGRFVDGADSREG